MEVGSEVRGKGSEAGRARRREEGRKGGKGGREGMKEVSMRVVCV